MTAVSNLRLQPTHAPRYRDRKSRHNKVEWLIDNSNAYKALLDAVRNSRKSIKISQLAFDADCVAHSAARSREHAPALITERELLLDAILEASSTNRVTVEILLNSSLLLDTARPLRRSISSSARDTSRVEVRGISRFPRLLHAKMVIIDDHRAFLIGSPFVNGYWDDSGHAPIDGRRPRRELGGRPLHDVSVAVEGPIVRELAAVFADLWNAADGDVSAAVPVSRPTSTSRMPDAAVQIVTTLPSRLRARNDEGSVEILDALLDGIAGAEELIYIEHQYLSSRPVVTALSGALKRHPDLEIVMVLNQNPDVTAYRGWQNARLIESGMLGHSRVGVYTLWSGLSGEGDSPVVLNQVFVHSKVVIVDDRWAMVGSANLDGVSLNSYGSDFSGALPRRIFQGVRNVDVGLIICDDARGGAQAGSANELRIRLWQEHLGRASRSGETRPETGWAALWQKAAHENVAALNERAPRCRATGTFILPYSLKSSPRTQLKNLGVSAKVDLQYEPGWLEVHCSPAWVRNIFL